MKTSTPNNAHPPRKHSLNRNYLAIEDNDEIAAEIQRRKEEAINKSSEVRRKSIAAPLLAGLTASELTQHCKDCIKLSTENKINTKNAFSFLLIDAMAAMAKKGDSEINKNFQVAGCTLDASVKIYGYRVDAVHTEAMKMAGSVLCKEVNLVENVENGEENKDENEVRTKLKKKKKKKLTVVPPESLNAEAEEDLLMDVTFHQSVLMNKTHGNDLLIKIPKFNDNCVLYINSDYVSWPSKENASLVPPLKGASESFDTASLMAMLKDVEISSTDQLCPLYHNFEFGKGLEDTPENMSDGEITSPDRDNGFEFDINASMEDMSALQECDAVEVETQRNRLQVPAGGYESDQEIHLPPVAEKKAVQHIPLSDLKNRITHNELEYSMFDEQVLKAWAGPSYWKVRPSRKDPEEGKENENNSRAVASKSTRKAKVKPTAGLFDVAEGTLAKYLACREKTILNKVTMLNWSHQNVTVPKDCQYKAKNFLSLFHFPDFFIKLYKEEQVDEVGEGTDSKNEHQEELEYCSNVSMQGMVDEDDCRKDSEEEENEQFFDKEEIWDEKNMVAVPVKVEKIQVSSVGRKKNVDIKYLKKCLWNMLVSTGDTKKAAVEARISEPVSFSEIMRTYCTNMPNNLTASLSAPLIFNALLHLTNEKCLVLTQDKSDKSDFFVSQ